MQQSESLFGYFESLREPSLQSLHGLLLGQGELEACAGGGVDVQIHGGFSRDGLAGRSPATGAAPGARMLVHSITCARRRRGEGTGREEGGKTRRARVGMKKGFRRRKRNPSLRLSSLGRQHSELSVY